MQTKDPSTLLTQRTVMALIGIGSRETLARWIRRGQFPRPMKVGGGGLRWLPSDIDTWLRTCDMEREQHNKALAKGPMRLAASRSARRSGRCD